MRAPEDVGRIRLRVPAEELDRGSEPEPVERRLRVGHEPPADEQARPRVLVEQVPERLERELEPVRLRLVAAEQDDGPVGRRRRPA